MSKNRILLIPVFLILCFHLSADDFSVFVSEKQNEYLSKPSSFPEKDLSGLLEVSILINDYEFAYTVITDYLGNPNSVYNENLYIMFLRFAYASNDQELMDAIIKRIPAPLNNDISKTHDMYLEISSMEKSQEPGTDDIEILIAALPDQYRSFYESLINFSEFYLYFTPLTFSSSGHDEQGNAIDPYAESDSENPAGLSGISGEDTDSDEATSEEDSNENSTVEYSNTYIQVGSFTVEENAVELAKELNLRSFKASISESSIQGQTYFRVIVQVEKGYSLEDYLDILYEHGYGGIRY